MSPASAGTSAARAREHLLELLTPLVSDAGFDLEDITVAAAGRRSLVRVIVDTDGGIDLDAVATVSRVVSEALDTDPRTESALAGSYVLEVSSPGVDRPLRERRHWQRAVGRLVHVPVAGSEVAGRVVSTAESGVTMHVEGGTREIAWDDLGQGRVQVEFNRSEED